MKDKYLHIFHDEKFTNTIVRQFLDTGVQDQTFIVIYDSKQLNPNYILSPDLPVEIVYTNSNEYSQLISSLDKFSCIFIHFLCDLKLEIIEKGNQNSKIIWMCWGQDIHKLIIDNSYLPATRNLLFKNHNFQEFYWRHTVWLRRIKFSFSRKKRILKRINYCCPVIEEDLLLINKTLHLNIKYLPFHYGSLENILSNQINSFCTGTNILVGNSSTYASNHLDCFRILSHLNLGHRLIITPLNYGDLKYGDQIEKHGYKTFNNNFKPLRNFLPIEEYNPIIASCSVAIFNHIRQQALGNIIISLWLGARVYLNNNSLLFKYLKKINLTIFSIQDHLVSNNKMALEALPLETVHQNRKILLSEFGTTKTIQLTKNIFTTITI